MEKRIISGRERLNRLVNRFRKRPIPNQQLQRPSGYEERTFYPMPIEIARNIVQGNNKGEPVDPWQLYVARRTLSEQK